MKRSLVPDPHPGAPILTPRTGLHLFHVLGGSADWYRARVAPLAEHWNAALCAHLPATRMASGFEHVIACAAFAAEAVHPTGAGAPELRLAAAHRAAGEAIVRLQAPGRAVIAAPPVAPDILAEAAAWLVRSGCWSPTPRHGRWRHVAGTWSLLWPLAGHDLRRRIDPALELQPILAGLATGGYLAAETSARAVLTGIRSDGRALAVLPVHARFLVRIGLSDAPPPSARLEPATGQGPQLAQRQGVPANV